MTERGWRGGFRTQGRKGRREREEVKVSTVRGGQNMGWEWGKQVTQRFMLFEMGTGLRGR